MSRVEGLLNDLAAEHDGLDAVLAGLSHEAWSLPTPARGWSVRDQVSHLTYFDASAALALVSPDRFAEHRAMLLSGQAGEEPDLSLGRSLEPLQLLESWRTGRVDLLDAAAAAVATRVPWYGPDMSLASFVTARLMETWAHGQDVRDALGLPPAVSDRLRHLCHLGVAARRYAHEVHGLADDGTLVRVEAVAPGGELWTWGADEAQELIRGSALGLALLFTQRRHLDDTDVQADGTAASRWLGIAQAFAGPAGSGREPGLPVAATAAARPPAASGSVASDPAGRRD